MSDSSEKPSVGGAVLLLGLAAGAAGIWYMQKRLHGKPVPRQKEPEDIRLASLKAGDILLFHDARGRN